ncbi:MAG: FG-GAP-like repeat-containing protein, partial [Candidatus Zixiibacteriota bacterium]
MINYLRNNKIYKSLSVLFVLILFTGTVYSHSVYNGKELFSTKQNRVNLSGEPIWIYDSNWHVKHIESADLNGDMIPDIIGAEYSNDYYGEPSTVYALDGLSGDTIWTYPLDDGARSMTVGDINNDGTADVIIGASNHTTNTPDGRIHAIDGKNGAQLWTYYTGSTNQDVSIGNFNGGDYLDVAVACFDDYVYAIDGETGGLIWQYLVSSLWINDVETADIDGDGFDDVAFAHEYLAGYDNHMGVLNGVDGSVIWEEIVSYIPLTVLIEDIDNDGNLETVYGVVYSDDHGEIIVKNALDGSFEWSYNLGSLNHTNGDIHLETYDIDDDSDLDLIVGTYLGPYYIYAFNGDTNTPMLISEMLDGATRDIAFGDVTGDGVLDIIAATYDRVQVLGTDDGKKLWYYSVAGTISSVAVGDFDDDGTLDVAAGGSAEFTGFPPDPGKTIWALKTVASPLMWEYPFGQYGNAIAVGNLNGDVYEDVVSVCSLDDKVWAFNGLTGAVLWNWTGSDPPGGVPSVEDALGDGPVEERDR